MPSPNSSLILRQVKGSKLTIAEMDGDLLYLAQTLSSSDGTGVIQVTGSSFDASNTNLTGSGLSLLNITNVAQTDVLSYDSTTGQVYYVNTGSIGRLPAPSNTYIQYNSGSDFGATGSFRFIYTVQSLQQGEIVSATGQYSHAQGSNTTAQGDGSHAEGYETLASGDYSHAEGYQTYASGNYSHAEGYQTTASGNYSHAGGRSTITSGSYQSVIGQYNISSTSQSAFIIGDGVDDSNRHNILFVSQSHFEVSASNLFFQGLDTSAQSNVLTYDPTTGQVYYTASGNVGGATPPAPSDTYIQYNSGSNFGATGSFRFIYTSESLEQGSGVTASGFYSHAQGTNTIASGSWSHAEGSVTIASGDYSHAEGYQTLALGPYSHAEGYQTTASDSYSHAEGRNTIALGYISHAEGRNTIASGEYSHAEGRSTTASGDYSHAAGRNAIASGSYQSVIGQFNVASTSQSAFIIGDGTADNTRHNVLFVSQSHFEADAPNTYFKNLGTTAQSNVLTYNSSTGQLFYAASSSLIVTNALTASYVTSSNIVGTVTSASYAATASFTSNIRASSASVASFVPAGGGDYISNQIFFSPQFPNNNYAITVTGEDARSWTIQSKESASFVINTNSSVALSGPVYWIAMQFNS